MPKVHPKRRNASIGRDTTSRARSSSADTSQGTNLAIASTSWATHTSPAIASTSTSRIINRSSPRTSHVTSWASACGRETPSTSKGIARRSQSSATMSYESFIPSQTPQELRWLEWQTNLLKIKIALEISLNFKTPNHDVALELLEELNVAKMDALMLKKYPGIVNTVRKMMYNMNAACIRELAHGIYKRMWGKVFNFTTAKGFYKQFRVMVKHFREKVHTLRFLELDLLTSDPTVGAQK